MKHAVEEDIRSRVARSCKHDWLKERLLPQGDPHIDEFFALSDEGKGVVGYCLEPLVRLVAERLGPDLSFLVLMCSLRTEQDARAAPTAALDFTSINNAPRSPEAQERFRNVFRFVSHEEFDRSGVQTSRILLQNADPDHSEVVYRLRGDVPHTDEMAVVSVEALVSAVAASPSFRALDRVIKQSRSPSDLISMLSSNFQLFTKFGALEQDVLTGGASKDVLRTFEHLMTRFRLKRSSEVRRRLLNYFVWMLLCDEKVATYNYFGQPSGAPIAEFICATRKPFATNLREEFNSVAKSAFTAVLQACNVSRAPRLLLATLDDERKAIDDVNEHRSQDVSNADIASRKAGTTAELDSVLTEYLPGALVHKFGDPPQNVSLAQFWPSTGERVPAVDLSLDTLRQIFDDRATRQDVNPFLVSVYPICNYISNEMDATRVKAIIAHKDADLSGSVRKIGEEPAHPSGLLSLNVVLWDLKVERFRYCSVRFVEENQVYRNHFEVLFRLLETPQGDPYGVRGSVLLLSDVLFRESVRPVAPICLSFRSPAGCRTLHGWEDHHYLGVGHYIDFLETGAGHEAFQRLYEFLVLEDQATDAKQLAFSTFCKGSEADCGVRRFLDLEPRHGDFLPAVGAFLKHHGVRQSEGEATIARFLGYLTWLWLCYRDRVAYYYYIPARLPLNERVGGFAIASEVPLPPDIIKFLFVSVAPRVVLYPALLHHGEAAGHFSRAVQECWFKGLPHVLHNSYGIKDITRAIANVLGRAKDKKRKGEPFSRDDVDWLIAQMSSCDGVVSSWHDVTKHLSNILSTGSVDHDNIATRAMMEYCKQLSARYASDHGVTLSILNVSDELAALSVPTPVLLVLWHLVLNACAAASECPRSDDRDVSVVATRAQPGQPAGLRFTVSNRAPAARAKDLEGERTWRALANDRDNLLSLWMDAPGVSASDVIDRKVVANFDSDLCDVTVAAYVPAISVTRPS